MRKARRRSFSIASSRVLLPRINFTTSSMSQTAKINPSRMCPRCCALRSRNRVRRVITSCRWSMKCSIISFSPIVRGRRPTMAMLIMLTVTWHCVY